MGKQVFFLSGLPRTGSTLLGSLLAQNPTIHVTPTSPLYPLLVSANETLNSLSVQYTFNQIETGHKLYPAMARAVHAHILEPIIFDKHRGWPRHVEAIKSIINPKARVICTVRPIAEIITSYCVLADKDPKNFIDTELTKRGKFISNETRAELLWSEYMKVPYDNVIQGLKTHPDNILLVNYRDLVSNPAAELARIYTFTGIKSWAGHVFKGIVNSCAEDKDAAWGMHDLHTIRPDLEMRSPSPNMYLSQAAIEYFSQFDIQGVA